MLVVSVPMLAQTWSKDLEKAAKKGDVASQIAVGNAYFNGDGVDANKAKAAQWYYKATLANSAEAKEKLCLFYSKELEKLAKTDNEALYHLGACYFEGNGIEKNVKKGLKLLNEARLNGHPEAFAKMGSTYTEEFSKMAEKIAMKEGNYEGFYHLGMCALNGSGCNKDFEVAMQLFETAMRGGDEKGTKKFCGTYSERLLSITRSHKSFGLGGSTFNMRIDYDDQGADRRATGVWCVIDDDNKEVVLSGKAQLEYSGSYYSGRAYLNDAERRKLWRGNVDMKLENGVSIIGEVYFDSYSYGSLEIISGKIILPGNVEIDVKGPIKIPLGGGSSVGYRHDYVKEDTITSDTIDVGEFVFDVKDCIKKTTIRYYICDEFSIEADTTVVYKWGDNSKFGRNYYNCKTGEYNIESEDGYIIEDDCITGDFVTSKGAEPVSGRFCYMMSNESYEGGHDRRSWDENGGYDKFYNVHDRNMFRSFNKDKAQKLFTSVIGYFPFGSSNKSLKSYDRGRLESLDMYYYGMTSEQYEKIRKENSAKAELEKAKKYLEDVTKKYGAAQANLLKSRGILKNQPYYSIDICIKGLHMDIFEDLRKRNGFNGLEHWLTLDDGTSIYYYYILGKRYAKLWIKGDYITSVVLVY